MRQRLVGRSGYLARMIDVLIVDNDPGTRRLDHDAVWTSDIRVSKSSTKPAA